MERSDLELGYEEIPHLDRASASQRLESGGSEAVEALYSIALHDEDDDFATQVCLNALQSDDSALRSAAAGVIGEMVFVVGRSIDLSLLRMRLEEARVCHPELAGRIDDSLADLQMAESRKRTF